MNAMKLNQDQKTDQIEIINEKTTETEQNSNAKLRMLPKPSPTKILRKRG